MTAFSIGRPYLYSTLGKPSIGVNVNPPNDSMSTAFLNRLRQCRKDDFPSSFTGNVDDYRDPVTGRISSLPVGVDRIEQIVLAQGQTSAVAALTADLVGVNYIYKWEGSGTDNVTFAGGFNVTQLGDRRYRVSFTGIGNRTISHTGLTNETIPQNPVLVPEVHEARLAAGEVFTPEYIAHLTGFSCLRFLDGMETNGSSESDWALRSTPSTFYQGAPDTPYCVEYLVLLCNLSGADGWFTLPVLVDDNYVENFSAYTRDNMGPGRFAHFEYGNENWNFNFLQYGFVRKLAEQYWDSTDGQDYVNYHAMRSTRIMRLINRVYGANRYFKRVLAWQQAGFTSVLLTAPLWAASDPGEYTIPALEHDMLACSSYFGNGILSDTNIYPKLVNEGQASAQAYMESLAAVEVLNPVSRYQTYANAAKQYGMDFAAYEGGQHNSFVVGNANSVAEVRATFADASAFQVGEVASQTVTATVASRTATTVVLTSSVTWSAGVALVGLTSGANQVPTALSNGSTTRTFTVPNGLEFNVGETVRQVVSGTIYAKTATTISIDSRTNADWPSSRAITSPSVPAGATPSSVRVNELKPGMLELIQAVNYGTAMADLLDINRANVFAAGGTLICEFNDLGAHSKFGSWARRFGLQDTGTIWTRLKAWISGNPQKKPPRGARSTPTPSVPYSAYRISGQTEVTPGVWRCKAGTLLGVDVSGLIGTETVTYSWQVNGVQKATSATLTFAIDANYPVGATLTCVTTINGTPYTSRGVLIVA